MSLSACDLHLRLGGTPILRGVDFDARAGEVTMIIGPNGSGKTTLMRLLSGEVAPDAGTVTLNEAPLATLTPEAMAARRAVLPQATPMAFPFSVAEIVGLGQMMTGSADPSLIAAALDRVGLAGFQNRLHQQLSGGQQQRVQLARVLVQVWQPVGDDGAPRWLLLDEPVSSLDIAHQLDVMRLAADYAAAGGGVVAVMHDLNLTAMFADRITLLMQGKVLAAGTPEAVLTDATLSRAYGCPLRVNRAPSSGIWLLPQSVDGFRCSVPGSGGSDLG